MSAKTKITEEFPWTLAKALREIGVEEHLRPCYSSLCPEPDHVTEGGRRRWKENPLPSKLYCCVYAKKSGDTTINVCPLAHLAGWQIVYTGTRAMAGQCSNQLLRAWSSLPHKDPIDYFEFDPVAAKEAIDNPSRVGPVRPELLQEVPLLS